MMKNGLSRAAVLRQHEVYCYQAVYYLLEDEALAQMAALNTLEELLQDEAFFQHSAPLQRQTVKRLCMKHALKAKGISLSSTG